MPIPGASGPRYVLAGGRHDEEEYSIVTEGEIGFRSGDREVVLGPGGYIAKPRGELHAMWNAGAVRARIIEIISPAGFEHFFREVAELIAAGHTRPSRGLRCVHARAGVIVTGLVVLGRNWRIMVLGR